MAAAVPAPIPTPCEVCGKTLPSKCAYLLHRKACKAELACGQCTERFRNKTLLLAHQKVHRARWVCAQCETAPFCSQGSLNDHLRLAHGAEHTCPCGKRYSSNDHLVRHMKACTAMGPALVCDCGVALQTMGEFHDHQEGCILSRPGATTAVKRRFSEIAASGEDSEAAALEAFDEVARAAWAKLATTCAKCGGSFANAASLGRHKRKLGH